MSQAKSEVLARDVFARLNERAEAQDMKAA